MGRSTVSTAAAPPGRLVGLRHLSRGHRQPGCLRTWAVLRVPFGNYPTHYLPHSKDRLRLPELDIIRTVSGLYLAVFKGTEETEMTPFIST